MLNKTRAFYLVITVFMASSLMFISCSEDDSNPTGNNFPTYNLSCSVDGDFWEAYGVFSRDVDGAPNAIALVASNPELDIFSVVLESPKIGANEVSSASGNFGTMRVGDNQYITEEGVITLTTLSATRVAGTFEFSAKCINISNPSETKTVNVTNGQFDLDIETE